MIASFGRYVVTNAKADPALGRSIGAVQQLRQLADYLGDAPELDKAQKAVEQADVFVAAMRDIFTIPLSESGKKPAAPDFARCA